MLQQKNCQKVKATLNSEETPDSNNNRYKLHPFSLQLDDNYANIKQITFYTENKIIALPPTNRIAKSRRC